MDMGYTGTVPQLKTILCTSIFFTLHLAFCAVAVMPIAGVPVRYFKYHILNTSTHQNQQLAKKTSYVSFSMPESSVKSFLK